MYKNWNKKTAKRYLMGEAGIIIVGFLITFVLMIALAKNNYSAYDLTSGKIFIYSLLLSLIPAFSFTGFVVAMLNMTNFKEKNLVLIVVFALPFTILMIPFGAIMTIPTVIKCIIM